MASDPELLLERADWVRRLAGGLAASAADADDLAQDALLAALERPPRAGVPLGKWLAAVVRNRSRSQARERARRRAREELFAHREGDSRELEPAKALERLEAHRRLVDAVRALDAPLRDALLWRYFDGLLPREIARRTGLPVRTVHTRLSRGLARLRSALERQEGPPLAAWLPLLLAPDAPRSLFGAAAAGSTSTLLGGLLVGTKTKLVVGAVLCSGLFFAWRALPGGPAEPPEAARTEPAVPAAAALAAPAAEAARASPTEPAARNAPRLAQSVTAAEPAPAEPAARPPLAGLVIDLEGRPVAGVAVGYLPPSAGHPAPGSHGLGDDARTQAVSGADGRFELAVEGEVFGPGPEVAGAEVDGPEVDGTVAAPTFGHVAVIDPNWTAVFEPLAARTFSAGSTGEPMLVVVAPSVRLAGRVSDEGGAGVAGAELSIMVQRWDHPQLPESVESLRLVTPQAVADERGNFELHAYGAPGAYLVTTAAGFTNDVRQPPMVSTQGLSIVLARPASGAGLLAGSVVDASGAPVEGARVALGFEQAESDRDGRFVLRLSSQSPDATLSALKQGHLPAVLARHGADSLAADAWPDPLVLALGGPPLELSGRVLDAAGEPASGIEVELVEKTEFGPVEVPGQPFMTTLAQVEDLLSGRDPYAEGLEVDGEGRFRVGGLLPKAYALRAIDRALVTAEDFGPFEAGSSGLVLRLAPARVIPRLAGRVLDLAGEPLAGISASALCVMGGGEPTPENYGNILHSSAVACDPDGGFAFERLSASATHLAFHGEPIGMVNPLPIPLGADLEHLEFRLPRRCRLRVELGQDEGAPGSFELRDAEGQPLMLFKMEGEFGYSSPSGLLNDQGASETYSAPETAALFLARLHGGRTIERPIRLDPDELTLIGP